MKNNTILTREKLSQYLITKQIDILSNITEKNVLLDIIQNVVTFVRAEVMSCPSNTVGDNPLSIPETLETTACHLVIEQLHTRIPSLDLSKDQVRNAENARKLLKRVAKGEFVVSAPGNLDKNSWVIHSRKRSFSSNNLKGL